MNELIEFKHDEDRKWWYGLDPKHDVVDVLGAKPELVNKLKGRAQRDAEFIFRATGKKMVITSYVRPKQDGDKHTLHHYGLAFDKRVKNLPVNVVQGLEHLAAAERAIDPTSQFTPHNELRDSGDSNQRENWHHHSEQDDNTYGNH